MGTLFADQEKTAYRVDKIKNAAKRNEVILGIDIDPKTPTEKVFESIEELKHGLFHSLPILSHVTVSLGEHVENLNIPHIHLDHS